MRTEDIILDQTFFGGNCPVWSMLGVVKKKGGQLKPKPGDLVDYFDIS
jgi:hypothetical protein